MELLEKTFEYSLKSFKENIKKGKSILYIESDQSNIPLEVKNFFSASKANKDILIDKLNKEGIEAEFITANPYCGPFSPRISLRLSI